MTNDLYDENTPAEFCFAYSLNGEGVLFCPKCGNGQDIYKSSFDLKMKKKDAICANCLEDKNDYD